MHYADSGVTHLFLRFFSRYETSPSQTLSAQTENKTTFFEHKSSEVTVSHLSIYERIVENSTFSCPGIVHDMIRDMRGAPQRSQLGWVKNAVMGKSRRLLFDFFKYPFVNLTGFRCKINSDENNAFPGHDIFPIIILLLNLFHSFFG